MSLDRRMLVLWQHSQGQAWAPQDGDHPFIVELVRDGWLRRSDGLAGAVVIKDAFLDWTPAARAAIAPGELVPGELYACLQQQFDGLQILFDSQQTLIYEQGVRIAEEKQRADKALADCAARDAQIAALGVAGGR